MSQKGGGRYLDVTTKEVANVRLAYAPTPFLHKLLLIIIIIIINGGILSLTDSHHHHHGQNPTMVGICHGGNVLGNHFGDMLLLGKLMSDLTDLLHTGGGD